MTGKRLPVNSRKNRSPPNKPELIKGVRRMAIKKELLEILRCPKCKGPIHPNPDETGLICEQCRLMYEIREDIPIMLIEEAKPI
jgi:uncharacterized protein YbaR (Trm112 family)